MNKEIFDGLPSDERPVAAKLNSVSETMNVPQNFQWELESQLMETYKDKTQPAKNRFAQIMPALGWGIVALGAVFLLNWASRSLSSDQPPVAGGPSDPAASFESMVRQGNMCAGPLALAHGFSISMTNEDKTAFTPLDKEKVIGELRLFSWSLDGSRLAIAGTTTGSGNIYLTDSTGSSLQPVLSESPLGYLMDVAWARDGKQLLTWSVQNNSAVYLVNADGSDVKEVNLGIYMIGTPQFAPDNKSIIFLGSNTSTYGLFEVTLNDLRIRQISKLVEDERGFAISQDGSRLAYFEMDRDLGEARLVAREFSSEDKTTLATLPIPKGSGSSIPDVANLSWSQDGTKLVFEFGRTATDRAIYLAHADGSGLVKVIDAAHAPTISADGNCLAYISDKQVFLLDLTDMSTFTSPTPLFLADVPPGRSIADFRLDKLGWRPATIP